MRETNTVKRKTSVFFEDWEVWGSLQDNYLIVAGCYELRRRRAKILKKAACIVDLLSVFRLDFHIILRSILEKSPAAPNINCVRTRIYTSIIMVYILVCQQKIYTIYWYIFHF